MLEQCEKRKCAAYDNPYAAGQYHIGDWLVETSHGSGDGRSYGVASVRQAESCNWWNDSCTNTTRNFGDDEAAAKEHADSENKYYDGSDYGAPSSSPQRKE